ncbi:uncharacterized protein LOC100898997 [Galendromus occidentalis]|uniref:Uncharacterized protein LOC100898997 n=1 Tax=Galendromus occidentalis TaxID=34638 RepID=A0AAJ6QUQ1_9ACAR|nr:uncharacterized protein LOC100898997 [Galendromus occidentalis]
MKWFLSFALALKCLSDTTEAEEVILMEPFDPTKAGGLWYIYSRNQNLLEKTNGAKCLIADIEHDAGGMDLYKVEAKWTDPSLGDMDITLHVVDDKVHPAQYFFLHDEHRIALSILGTDYDNYLVGHGMLGLKATYFTAFRKLPADPAVMAAADKILQKNKVTRDFQIIDHSSC